MHPSPRRSAAGGAACVHPAFTLVELLAVVAVIAILTGILVPTLGAARTSALKARTRVQFSQWAAAFEQFRQEYGYYPVVGTDGKLATAADTLKFIRTLSGRNPDGSAVADPADLNGNLKRISFCAFAGTDFLDPDRPGTAWTTVATNCCVTPSAAPKLAYSWTAMATDSSSRPTMVPWRRCAAQQVPQGSLPMQPICPLQGSAPARCSTPPAVGRIRPT